jgi:class 3 adenylate cyclase
MDECAQLEQAIAALSQQRAALGDIAVEAALAGLRERLAALQTSAQPPSAPSATSMAGERKLVTVMFADISGFTPSLSGWTRSTCAGS